MVALAWVGILRGFGADVVDHVTKHRPAYPVIVHFHAVIFVAWLVLFTVQIFLVRTRRIQVHKRLGFMMVWLAAVMAVIGPATALTVQHHDMGSANADPAFLSIQFTDIVAFVGLTAAAIILRKRTEFHKRLMLLGTLYITDAGFSRWLFDPLARVLGSGYWPFWTCIYFGPVVLAALVGIYDIVTRRRLHPAYMAGITWMFANQVLAVSLYFSPVWLGISKRVIAGWP